MLGGDSRAAGDSLRSRGCAKAHPYNGWAADRGCKYEVRKDNAEAQSTLRSAEEGVRVLEFCER